jgi:hypothetical protein
METLYAHPVDGRLFQIATMCKVRGGVRAYDLSFRVDDPTTHPSVVVTFPSVDGLPWVRVDGTPEDAAYYEAIVAE